MTAVIELKARLDEERNILWAQRAGEVRRPRRLRLRRPEDALQGRPGRPPRRGRRHPPLRPPRHRQLQPADGPHLHRPRASSPATRTSARTSSALFNYLTGYGELPQWRKLVVAPSRLQTFMIEKIDQEAANQKAGKPARIIAKINGLLEPAVVQALYRASQAGVKIDIVCRGICSLRPGMPGVSDNIRVISIVDRFLEHSRIFYFGNGGDPQVYIGSADWMDRNLSRRVEVVFPIEQPDLKQRLIDILTIVAGGQREGPGAAAGRHLPAGEARRAASRRCAASSGSWNWRRRRAAAGRARARRGSDARGSPSAQARTDPAIGWIEVTTPPRIAPGRRRFGRLARINTRSQSPSG